MTKGKDITKPEPKNLLIEEVRETLALQEKAEQDRQLTAILEFVQAISNDTAEVPVSEIERRLFLLPKLIYQASLMVIRAKQEMSRQKIYCDDIRISPASPPGVTKGLANIIVGRKLKLIDLEGRYLQAGALKEALENEFYTLRKVSELRKITQ